MSPQVVVTTQSDGFRVERAEAQRRAAEMVLEARDHTIALQTPIVRAFYWLEKHMELDARTGQACPMAAAGAIEALRLAVREHDGKLLPAVQSLMEVK